MNDKMYSPRALGLLLAAFVVAKWMLIPFVHWFDADAVTRHHMTQDLVREPQWLHHGNWPPIFFYTQVFFYTIVPSWSSPLVITVLLNGLSCFFIWRALRSFFTAPVAYATVVIFALCPLVFRLSLINLSETMYLFFVTAGLALLSARYGKWSGPILAISGVCFSLAAGVRYEAVILSAMVACWMAWKTSLKQAAQFAFCAALFPLYWMISNSLYSEHALSSLQWSADAMAENRIDSAMAFVRRLGWFPASLLLCLGPYGCFVFWKNRQVLIQNKAAYSIAWMPLAYLILSIAMCLLGSLLLQHRFTLTTYLLCLPLIALVINGTGRHALRTGIVWATSTFLCAYLYTTRDLQPVPRLNVPAAHTLLQHLRNELQPSDAFIHAFYDWQVSYFLLYHSGHQSKDIAFAPPGTNQWHHLDDYLQQHPGACAVINEQSPLLDSLRSRADLYHFDIIEKTEIEQTILYRLKKKQSSPAH